MAKVGKDPPSVKRRVKRVANGYCDCSEAVPETPARVSNGDVPAAASEETSQSDGFDGEIVG